MCELVCPFNGLKTNHQQILYSKKYFDLVESREILLYSRTEQVFNSVLNKYETKNVSVTCQYISVIDTLKCILTNETMYDFMFNKAIKSNDCILKFWKCSDTKVVTNYVLKMIFLYLRNYNSSFLIKKKNYDLSNL